MIGACWRVASGGDCVVSTNDASAFVCMTVCSVGWRVSTNDASAFVCVTVQGVVGSVLGSVRGK